jgi:PEP-CTERM motif
VQFTDLMGGAVELTLTSHITRGNTLEGLFFNFNPAKNEPVYHTFVDGILNFTLESATGGLQSNYPVLTSNDGLNAGGNIIDIWMRGFGQLADGDTATYLITGGPIPEYGYELGLDSSVPSLMQISASDFDFVSDCGSGNSCDDYVGYVGLADFAYFYPTGVRDDYYGPTSGQFITTSLVPAPEPASMLIFGISMLGLAGVRRGRRRSFHD